MVSLDFYIHKLICHTQGKHSIAIDHDLLGKTCGLLPVGVDSAILTTSGLQWNLSTHLLPPSMRRHCINCDFAAEHVLSFDGLISVSNHLLPEEKEVKVITSRPIWWTAELKKLSWD
jgi:thiamine pyrophosphokinase